MMTEKTPQSNAEKTIRDIHRVPLKHSSPEDKIRFVLKGLRGKDSDAWCCRYITALTWVKLLQTKVIQNSTQKQIYILSHCFLCLLISN